MAPEDITPEPDESGSYEYVEEVVEYRDNRTLRTLLAVILAILILLLSGVGYLLWTASRTAGGPSGAAATGKMQWIRSIYGWGPGQGQQLSSPSAVANAPDGTIWANSNNKYAIAFNPDGTLDRLLMSKPTTTTSQAATGAAGVMGHGAAAVPNSRVASSGVQAVFSLDVDSKGSLFIVDDASGNVLKFSPEGQLEQGWSVPGVAKAAANDNSVAVTNKGAVGAFSQATGAPIFDFGTRGQGKNQFDLPAGVHIDAKGFVYVADTQNQRVRKYTPSGRLVWDAGTVPDRKFQAHVQTPKGIFQLPTGVTTDSNGHVVVIDAFNYNITQLDGATGKKVASYGEYGQEDGQFDNPSAISYDPTHDYFVVADTGNNRVQVVRLPNSTPLSAGTLFNRAFDNPIWILCLPFLILLIALLITYLLSRSRKKREAAALAEAQAATQGATPQA